MRCLGTAALVAVALAGAACGTTVPQQATTAAGGGGLGAPGAELGGAAVPGNGVTASTPGGATVSGPASVDVATGPSGQPVAPSGGGGEVPARAVAAGAPVEIGIEISANADVLFKAAGGTGGGLGDNKAQATAVVDWINRTGGLRGHKVVPVFHTFDATSPTPSGDQQQEGCSTYTEDHHVLLAASPFNQDPSIFLTCLGKAGAAYLDVGYATSDDTAFRQYRNYFVPSDLGLDRLARTYVDRLVARGFLTAQSKVGLILYSEGRYERVRDRTLVPSLKAHGITVAKEFDYTPLYGSNAEGALSREAQESSSAVLAFRSAGVDRVLFLAAGADLPLLFMQAADSQGYKPKYGLHTLIVPSSQTGNPAGQLEGAMGIGWWPVVDNDYQHPPAGNAAAAKCVQIEKDAGVDLSDGAALEEALRYCDAFFFLRAASERAPSLDVAGLRVGAEALGAAYGSPMTFGTRFAAGRVDGAELVRDFTWSPGCTCFAYAGPTRRTS